MNILPHKSWHVKRKENIARVRADEAKAEEEEKEQNRRIQLAEQEARTAYLREKSRSKLSGNDGSLVPVSGSKSINLFADVEDGRNLKLFNEDTEKDKRAEKEKYEKSIGLLTYLGQSVLDAKGEKSWYEKPSSAKRQDEENFTHDEKRKKSPEHDTKKKRLHDPIALVHRVDQHLQAVKSDREKNTEFSSLKDYLMVKRNADKVAEKLDIKLPNDTTIPLYGSSKIADIPEKSRTKKRKHHKKEKMKSKRSKKRYHSSSSSSSSSSLASPATPVPSRSSASIEQLRAERLKREQSERARELELMCKHMKPEMYTTLMHQHQKESARKQSASQSRYNSAFNPEVAEYCHQRQLARKRSTL